MKLTKLQVYAVSSLLKNLENLVRRNEATVQNLSVLYNNETPNMVYVKYEKATPSADMYALEGKIVRIDSQGNGELINDKFEDVFAQSAFLSMCKPINMNKISEYIVD